MVQISGAELCIHLPNGKNENWQLKYFTLYFYGYDLTIAV
ncbi:MAG: hypothetical protein JWQ85_2630 [Mucilaginibacter sp.]|nr:hypothetical protein [Mucilaginibacter sp.]